MILQNKIKIKITNRNKNHYIRLGYDLEYGNDILVDINHLTNGSNVKIKVLCDICNCQLDVIYYNYNKYIKKFGIYTCKKCSINHKTRKTNMEKYGVEIPLQSKEILEKMIETNMIKYGNACCLLSSDVRQKTKKTSIEKYGDEIPSTSELSKSNRKKTNNRKYGVDNVFQSIGVKDKIRKRKLEDRLIIHEKTKREWLVYKNKVRSITRKFKKDLYEKWNGFDFYDREYIKDNMKLHYNDKKYPTIDHRLSVYYGFSNDISPTIIGDISNLVITKRYLNSKKNLKSNFN